MAGRPPPPSFSSFPEPASRPSAAAPPSFASFPSPPRDRSPPQTKKRLRSGPSDFLDALGGELGIGPSRPRSGRGHEDDKERHRSRDERRERERDEHGNSRRSDKGKERERDRDKERRRHHDGDSSRRREHEDRKERHSRHDRNEGRHGRHGRSKTESRDTRESDYGEKVRDVRTTGQDCGMLTGLIADGKEVSTRTRCPLRLDRDFPQRRTAYSYRRQSGATALLRIAARRRQQHPVRRIAPRRHSSIPSSSRRKGARTQRGSAHHEGDCLHWPRR